MKTILLISMSLSVCVPLFGVLEPLLCKPGEHVYMNQFESGGVDAPWKILQKTRFSVEDGCLKGMPSTPEYQASKPDHNGVGALIDFPLPVQDFIVYADICFDEGKNMGAFELGHHVTSLTFGAQDITFKSELNKQKKTEGTIAHKPVKGKWYSLLAEVHGDQAVIQIEGIGVIRAQSEAIAQSKKTIRIRGGRGGVLKLDNFAFFKSAGLK